MANTLKFGNGEWAVKEGSTLAYNDENGNFKPLPFDFTRASTATYVAKDGLIKTAAIGEPRIDFLNDSEGSLKLEPQRTNIITYSEDFTQTAWIKSNSTISANTTISPDGTQNASTLVISSSGYLLQQYTASVSAGGSWALSIFAKTQNTNFLRFGGATPSGTDTYSIQDMSSGWYRHSLVSTFASANASFNLQYIINEVGTNYIWGAQVEQGSYTTSLINTSGSSVTRVADDIALTLPDVDSFSSSNGFSVICKFGIGAPGVGTSQSFLTINDDTSSTYLGFGSNSTRLRCRVNLSGTAYLNTQDNALRTQNNSLFISCDSSGWSQGANGTTNFTGSNDASVFNKLTNISYSPSEVYGIIKIKELLIYNTRLTDAELETLTTL